MGKDRKPGRVTLADVAERAGVSTATVSLILSARKGWIEQFRPETIATVRRAAQRLGYRANLFASGLPTQGSLFFAVVLPDLENRSAGTWHHWAFEGALLAGVIEGATQRGVYSILATADYHAGEEQLRSVYQVIDGGVFGTIVRTPNAPLERFLRSRIRRGQRVVVAFPGRLAAWPTNAVDVDNTAVGQTAGRLLASRHRKRWALVRYQTLRDSWRLRIAALKRAAQQAGARLHTLLAPTGVDESTVAKTLAPRLARLKPDGVFAVDSISSVGATLASNSLGWRAAEDLDLLGCDCSLWQMGSLPTITAVDASWNDMGLLALRTLLSMCESGENRFDTILVKPRIVPGATCPLPEGFTA